MAVKVNHRLFYKNLQSRTLRLKTLVAAQNMRLMRFIPNLLTYCTFGACGFEVFQCFILTHPFQVKHLLEGLAPDPKLS